MAPFLPMSMRVSQQNGDEEHDEDKDDNEDEDGKCFVFFSSFNSSPLHAGMPTSDGVKLH